MSGINKYPASNAFSSFIDAPDPVYGSGSDGSVTISTNTTLTSDKYYYNLEISANTNLITGGYRIFVKNLLTLRNGSLIGFTTGSTANGSISGGGAAAAGNIQNALGGNSGSATAVAPTTANGGTGDKTTQSGYWYQPTQSSKGYVVTASQTTPLFLRGGAGGSSGAGGGVVILNARYITCDANTVNASISAPGTAGSGGGGGGVIIITSAQASLPANVSTNVVGGTGAQNGTVIYSQLV